jgi:hypothetical protein
MTNDPTRRDVLSAAVVAPLAGVTLPADAIAPPAWEAEVSERLAVASQLRIAARNRVHSGRDALQRWEGRNPFPHGQGVAARYDWAQRYCAEFERLSMAGRKATHEAAMAACGAICGEALALAGNGLADRQALARLLPYDAAGVIQKGLLARAAI